MSLSATPHSFAWPTASPSRSFISRRASMLVVFTPFDSSNVARIAASARSLRSSLSKRRAASLYSVGSRPTSLHFSRAPRSSCMAPFSMATESRSRASCLGLSTLRISSAFEISEASTPASRHCGIARVRPATLRSEIAFRSAPSALSFDSAPRRNSSNTAISDDERLTLRACCNADFNNFTSPLLLASRRSSRAASLGSSSLSTFLALSKSGWATRLSSASFKALRNLDTTRSSIASINSSRELARVCNSNTCFSASFISFGSTFAARATLIASCNVVREFRWAMTDLKPSNALSDSSMTVVTWADVSGSGSPCISGSSALSGTGFSTSFEVRLRRSGSASLDFFFFDRFLTTSSSGSDVTLLALVESGALVESDSLVESGALAERRTLVESRALVESGARMGSIVLVESGARVESSALEKSDTGPPSSASSAPYSLSTLTQSVFLKFTA
mmetsp:Transcript_26166/g.68858  ORF Transcript_26166/g.68858 Transcript_26166/m.68858 type:complete len:451 (+) Transcript_26166:1064-2416(+)